MAVVSRTARMRMDDAVTHATNVLQFVATATVEQTAAGGSVVITTVRTVAGAPPSDPDTLTLSVYDDAGALIRAFTLNPTSASQTSTFFFTDTGATGGAARHGTVELAVRATRTSLGTYDVETDGAPNTAPATFDTHLDRGYLIGTTTKVHAFSNAAAGGAKIEPAQYDESLFVRVTLGSLSYNARTLAVAMSAGGLSANTNSTAAVNRDVTFANVTDARFAAAVTTVSATVTAPNATLTGLPYTVFTATTADTITVDPRLSVSHLLQIDDSVFGAPPLSKNSASDQRLTTQIGFTDTNFRGARGTRVGNVVTEGINGLAFTVTLQDAAGNTTALTRSVTTVTQGGEAGWGPGFLQWTSQLPGGTWNKTVTLQAGVTDLTNAYLLNPTTTYQLLAANPNFRIVVGAGPYAAEDDHVHPGSTLLVGLAVIDMAVMKLLSPDVTPPPSIVVARFNQTLGRPEYLKADLTWVSAGAGATLDLHALTASAGDPQTYIKTFSMTVGTWTTADLFFVGRVFINGTPYTSPSGTPVLSAAANGHNANVLDAVGLALSGQIGFM